MSTEEPQDVAENEIESVDNFDDMNLKPKLLRGIYDYGFKRPSVIQQRAIVPIIERRHVILQAPSGAGKTTTSAISILQQLNMEIKSTQALILAPTRELAQEIQKLVVDLGGDMNIGCIACVGGTKVREVVKKLEEDVHIVVGTPGRVFDMINRGALKTDIINIFCLDEADDILSRGFTEEVYNVFKQLPLDVQVVFLSPTMPADVVEMVKKITRNPVFGFQRKSILKVHQKSYKYACSKVVLEKSFFFLIIGWIYKQE